VQYPRTRATASGSSPNERVFDDGIERIVCDVGIGGIHVDPDGAALPRRHATNRIASRASPVAAGGHDVGERGGADDAHGGAPFEIRGNEQWELRAALQRVELAAMS